MIKFRRNDPLTALVLIVHANFHKINFIATIDYKNILTMKNFQIYGAYMYVYILV